MNSTKPKPTRKHPQTHEQPRTQPKNHAQMRAEQNDDDMELFDLLCVALHFAGVKSQAQKQILEAYADELDSFDDNAPYGQEQMIEIIERLRERFPESFEQGS